MLFQQIEFRSKSGKTKNRFYIARHFGTRDIWIEAKLFRPDVRTMARDATMAARKADDIALREVDANGRIIEVISVEWLLERFKPDLETCRFFLSMEDAFDRDATEGKCIYQR